MKYLLLLWIVVVGASAVGCGGKGADKNPVNSAGDSTGTSLVVEDSTTAPPVEEVPVAPVLRLAFLSGQFGKYDVFMWKTDGSAPTNLTQNPGQYSGLAWSPDGHKLAFSQGSGVSDGSIYVLDIEENGRVKLTSQQGDYGELAWSPDGTRLAFTFRRNIYVMNADGSDMAALTTGSESGYDSSPAWSPDGSRIAFSRATALDTISFADVTSDVYAINADGTRLSRLNEDLFTGYAASLSWSPDGSQIAFIQYSGTGVISGQDIYLLNVREGNSTNLTVGLNGNNFNPAWSPDGSQIAFTSYGKGIYLVNANGSGRAALSHDSDDFPKWNSDGQKIAYVHYGSDLDIYQVDVAEGSRVNLTEQNSVPTKDIIFFTGFFAWAP